MAELVHISRRYALASVANAFAARKVVENAPPVRKFRPTLTRAPPCFDVDIEFQRLEWAEESKRILSVAKDALVVSELYNALSEGDMETASECIGTMSDRGMDVSQFENDVKFALLNRECDLA
jgi:hypothetical protein